ncbi:NLRP3 protein, partial [Caloenas nicobarica]|nr:NLRP3 protein [Caloenas nicobarica]
MAGEEGVLAVLVRALQGLTVKDFQEFKTKLSAIPVERGWNIPKDSLAKAAHPCALVSSMSRIYSQDATVDIAIGLFQEMNQRDLAEKLLVEQVKGYKQEYRECVVQEFCCYEEVNACLGDNLSVSRRFTDLTITRKPRRKRGGEREGVDTSCGCADAGNGGATVTVTAQTLFKPDEDGQTPQVVVLVGAPGMGKTMTVRKVMVGWVEGTLYTQFDYIFCIGCKNIAFTREANVVDLISTCCPHRRAPAGKILADQKKILFIFDGFEALGFSLVQPKDELSSDPWEVKPLETTLMSLLKKTVLPESSLLITTRPTALQSLERCLEGEYYAEILGFSAAMRKEYFHRHLENANKADVAFRFTRGNEILYSLCIIPVMSWIVCTILEQELSKKKNLIECSKPITQMSVFYLSWLLKSRGGDNPRDLQRFLPKLCSLAADGIWKHKVLFEERDIKDHSLDQPDLLPLFLNEKISQKDHGNVYSFTHLHLQEFFAAMFYVLEDEEEMVGDLGALTKDINMLLETYSDSRKDLNLTVRFLFGLVSQKSIEHVDKITGCRISPRAREDLLRWLQKRYRGIAHPGRAAKVSHLDTLHFLFEMNDESCTQSALAGFTDMDLQDIQLTQYDQMALSFCARQWGGLGCVTLRGCSFQPQDPGEEPSMAESCALGAGEHPHRQEELPPHIHPLCQALQHPGSRLQVLRLRWCRLSRSCCAELAELLACHPSLAQLELGDSALGDTGVRLLCQGLQQPGCRLRVLR